ncbi:MAG TPA: DUF4832 domain-containing protein [Planctomycetota bacterium]|nr:DUF4832 domain-containing protein [Planctomycetota bacterium]
MAESSVSSESIPVIKSRWRDAFHKDEKLQRVRPPEFKGYLPNPHRGTTTFQRFNGDALYPGLMWDDSRGPVEFKPFDGNLKNPNYPDTTLSYCRWLWSVLEPQKGKFRWDIIDGALKAGRDRGQTVQMRIQPYIGPDMPEWFWNEGGKIDPKADPKRKEPDHNHPSYLKHFGDVIRAFAKRYDGHPDLESFDIAYGGPCGECGGNTTRSTAKKLSDVYLQAFKKTQLVSMLGTFGCEYTSQFERVGWRADCYGDLRTEGRGVVPDHLCWNHMFDAYPKEIHENGVSERWKTAPVTMETCWTVGYWEKMGWDVDWIFEQGLKYHTSIFMPKSSFIPDRWREKFDAWDNKIGYRFVLRQINLPLESKAGAKIPFWLWVENIGCAPIYRNYPLALRFKQGKNEHIARIKTDIRQWMPGDWVQSGSVDFPKELKRGEVEVDIAILDEKLTKPRVLFAIRNTRDNGWHPLCKMDVI